MSLFKRVLGFFAEVVAPLVLVALFAYFVGFVHCFVSTVPSTINSANRALVQMWVDERLDG